MSNTHTAEHDGGVQQAVALHPQSARFTNLPADVVYAFVV